MASAGLWGPDGRRGRLLDRPGLADLAVSACRRVAAFLPAGSGDAWEALREPVLGHARACPAGPWRGRRLDLVRWSARQRAEVDLHGVAGDLDLPAGPGPLWPLLAAALWLHLGKGTTVGMGEVRVLPLPEE
jgi:hypothetical protein